MLSNPITAVVYWNDFFSYARFPIVRLTLKHVSTTSIADLREITQ